MTLILTEDQADTYFDTRRDASPWTSILETGTKTTELVTAQNQLELFYTLNTELETHRNAVCEQAYFNIRYGGGIEDRLSQRAVGVTEAGLIKEKFDKNKPVEIVICAYAMNALSDVRKKTAGLFVGVVALGRDESEAIG